MKNDLAATELLTEIVEFYPFYGEARIRAELRVEDALNNAARRERERCISIIEDRIVSYLRRNEPVAAQLQSVIEELQREPSPVQEAMVPPEEEEDHLIEEFWRRR